MTEQEWLDIFGQNLKDMLDYANMTQRELADTAGLSDSSVSHYLHGQKMPGIRAIINIAHALDVDVSELIDFGSRIIG